MKRIILLLSIIAFISNVKSQTPKEILWIRADSSSFYLIDNSKKCWYTIKLKTDTLFQIRDLIFFSRNKDLQMNNMFVDGGDSFKGANSDYAMEEYMLKKKMDWEYKYQKSNIKGKIKKGQELYYNIRI